MKLFQKAQPKSDHPLLYADWHYGPYSWCDRCDGLMEEGREHYHSDFGMLRKSFLPLSPYTGMRYDPSLVSVVYK